MRLCGENALAARLPSALAALATTWLLVAVGRRLGPPGAGALSGVVFATSMGLVIVARQVLFDSLLTLWITGVLAAFWFATQAENSHRPVSRRLLMAAYAGLGLAVLTKGLIGLALPLVIVGAYTVLARDQERLRRAWSPAGLLLFLAVALPWHVAAAVRQKEFVWFYVVNEHWLRFLGRRQPPDFHQDPIFSPALSLLLLSLPWGAFLPAAARREVAARIGRRLPREALFLFCWAVIPALFFTLSRTRTYYYQLPSVPALALLAGRFWARLASRPRGSPRERWLLAPAVVFAALVFGVWLFARFGSWGSLRNAAWHALGFACGGWLVAGLSAAAALIAFKKEAAAFAVLAASVLLMIAAAVRFASSSPHPVFRSEEPAARIITGLSPPEKTLVAVEGKFENHSSLAFYLPRRFRPLLVVDALGQGDLAFGSRLEDTREIFVSTPTMFVLADTRPLVYLTLSPSKLRVPPRLALLACNDEFMLWTNVGEVASDQ
jgi:4-amino-4-deoxy-L-arabinose transferase-like glycosyltransferase